MNANELADQLKECFITEGYWESDLIEMAESMLRQQQVDINCLRNNGYKTQYELLRLEFLNQQVEIEALKQIIDANNLIQNIGQFVKPQEKCPPTSWWKGDPTCGGITENYGLGKAQEK